MIDLEKIKNEVSAKHGFESFEQVRTCIDVGTLTANTTEDILNEVATEYAKQWCDEQIKACYNNSDVHFDESGMMDGYIRIDCVAVDKASILNTPNVVKP